MFFLRVSTFSSIWQYFRWIFAGILLGFLAWRVHGVGAWSVWPVGEGGIWLVLVVVGLMPLNWWMEVEKYRVLMDEGVRPQRKLLWRAVMAGVALGMITPWRVGAYGGRFAVLPVAARANALGAHVLGNIAQLFVLLLAGMIGLALLVKLPASWCIVLLAPTTVLILSYSYPNHWLRIVKPLLKRWDIGQWAEQLVRSTRFVRGQALGWAAARYAVYTAQYALLLKAWLPQLPWLDAAAGTAAIYLIQTGVPLPTIGTLAARATWFDLLWLHLHATAALTTVSAALFLINLALPALWGTWVLSRLK